MNKNPEKKRIILPIAIIILALSCAIIVILLIVIRSGNSGQELPDQLALGDKYLNEMDYEKAILAFKEALEIDPENTDALDGLHLAYQQWIEADSERAIEIQEDEITYLKTLLAKNSSVHIERLLLRIESTETVKAPTPTSPPIETPTPTAYITPTPSPMIQNEGTPTEKDLPPEEWNGIDFSQLLTWDTAQYILDRLVAEEGWAYNDNSHEMIYKDMMMPYGIGTATIGFGNKDANICLNYFVPIQDPSTGVGRSFTSGEATLQKAYDDIISYP